MRVYSSAAFAAALLLAGCSGNGTTPTPSVPVPTVANTYTVGITINASLYQGVAGPDGRVWMSEFSADNVAAATTAGVVTEYATGAGSQPNAIIVGPDSNIWEGGYGPGIRKLTTAGAITSYVLAGSHISEFTIGADANIWFGDYGNFKLGKITTTGVVTEYALPVGGNPCGIASGSDGNLWVSDCGNGDILKYSTAGTLLATYSAGLSHPTGVNFLISAPDGNLYLTEPSYSGTLADHICKITTAGVITEISTIAPNSYPNVLAIGKDGNVYFSESGAARLGKIKLASGTVSETPLTLAVGEVGTSAVVAAPDGRLWLGGRSAVYALTY